MRHLVLLPYSQRTVLWIHSWSSRELLLVANLHSLSSHFRCSLNPVPQANTSCFLALRNRSCLHIYTLRSLHSAFLSTYTSEDSRSICMIWFAFSIVFDKTPCILVHENLYHKYSVLTIIALMQDQITFPIIMKIFYLCICSHQVNRCQSVLMCYENHKNNDDPIQEKRRWPSEIGWQSFLMAAAQNDVPPSNLKAIIREAVSSRSPILCRHCIVQFDGPISMHIQVLSA